MLDKTQKLLSGARYSGLHIRGNESLLDSSPAVILNSRQGKFPKGSDKWVAATIKAVRFCAENGRTLICSVGMNTWEIVTWAIGEYGLKAILILPYEQVSEIDQNTGKFAEDFNLKLDNLAVISVPMGRKTVRCKDWWDVRDRLVYDLADEILPVSIRTGSRWESMIGMSTICGKRVNNQFRLDYETREKLYKTVYEMPKPGISYNWDFFTHYTRRFECPWPGEKAYEFYSDIVNSNGKYPRGADATLTRILLEQHIRASPYHMKKSKPSVALTSLPPNEAVKLMKWRKRYGRYTFEPYGVAIRKSAAIEVGIRSVRYVTGAHSGSLDDPEFTQTCTKGEWWRESEWRVYGDVDLRRFSRKDIRIVVPSHEEVKMFQKRFAYEVLSFSEMFESSIY